MYISGAYTPLQNVVIIYDAFIGGTEKKSFWTENGRNREI